MGLGKVGSKHLDDTACMLIRHKTTTSFLYILLNFFLIENAENVRSHPERHCTPTNKEGYTQPADVRCPSRADWPIVCACEEHSITARLKLTPRDGATLILLPAGLINNWQSEWRRLGADRILGLRFYTHHNKYPKRYIPKSKMIHLALQKREGEGAMATNACASFVAFTHSCHAEPVSSPSFSGRWNGMFRDEYERSQYFLGVTGKTLLLCAEAHRDL